MAYREQWGRDVVIDLIGYRRYGHNETDEAAYTQPRMAAQIKEHKPVSELYAERLVSEGVVTPDEVEAEGKERLGQLQGTLKELRAKMEAGEYEDPSSTAIGTGELDRTKSPEVETAVSEKRLRTLNEELLRVPDSFTIHRKLRKPLLSRVEKLDQGDDRVRATPRRSRSPRCSPRAPTSGSPARTPSAARSRTATSPCTTRTPACEYVPIQNLSGALAPFELHNSPLSEAACLGFEYGYSAASPESLILWEAQFGDFANSAQVIIDSFIVAGESKWGQTTRLPCCSRTATRAPAPSTRAPGSSASSSSAPRATSGSPTRPPPPSTSTCSAARRGSQSRGRWWCSRPRACCG